MSNSEKEATSRTFCRVVAEASGFWGPWWGHGHFLGEKQPQCGWRVSLESQVRSAGWFWRLGGEAWLSDLPDTAARCIFNDRASCVVSRSQLLLIRHPTYSEIGTGSCCQGLKPVGWLDDPVGRDGTEQPASVKERGPAIQGMNLAASGSGYFRGPPRSTHRRPSSGEHRVAAIGRVEKCEGSRAEGTD